MILYSVAFSRIPVKAVFSKNGNRYRKQSTRTACIIKPEEYAGQWFYFRMTEQCTVTTQKGEI